jgi:hypothetical protein
MENLKNEITKLLENLELTEKVNVINELREHIHLHSPFKNEPVDFVKWIINTNVVANDYNPNKVAPPEMELLEVSILNDGYTQPIVTWQNDDKDKIEVIDGFHRHRVGKESKVISSRIQGFLPTVIIRDTQNGKSDRIASTIRHNRARGKHMVNAMSDIVIELKNRNWSNERIAKELGMDADEILRLCQISGIESLFKDDDFSKSWNIDDSELEVEYEGLTDVVSDEEKEQNNFRTVNTGDKERIFHTYDKWECHKAGFYNSNVDGMSKKECEQVYYDFLTNDLLFELTLSKVISEWKHSCEHYLTNKSMNRIAWLGQAAVCYSTGVPSDFRGGWFLLNEQQQESANKIAYKYLSIWLMNNNLQRITFEEAMMVEKQTNIY